MRILFTSLLSLSASVVVVSVSGLDVSNNNLSDAIFIEVEGTPTGNLRRVLKGQDQGATDRGIRMLQGETKTNPSIASDENNGIFDDFQGKSPGEGVNGDGQGTTKGVGIGVGGGSCAGSACSATNPCSGCACICSLSAGTCYAILDC